eukprot:3712108-Pyramimonas_sp.AAC.1
MTTMTRRGAWMELRARCTRRPRSAQSGGRAMELESHTRTHTDTDTDTHTHTHLVPNACSE